MSEYLLDMRGIVKDFNGVKALDGVDFQIFPAEIVCLAGENDAGMRNEREVVRPRMGHSLARRRPDYLSRSCRVSSRSHLVQLRPRNKHVPSCRPIQNGLVTPSMPELEPGSGEGQSQSREQMCNERDGRPIKTSGCRQPADHGPCC